MQKKGSTYSVLVGMKSRAISMNVNVGIPKKIEKYLVSSSSEKVWLYTQRILYPIQKYLFIYIHCYYKNSLDDQLVTAY